MRTNVGKLTIGHYEERHLSYYHCYSCLYIIAIGEKFRLFGIFTYVARHGTLWSGQHVGGNDSLAHVFCLLHSVAFAIAFTPAREESVVDEVWTAAATFLLFIVMDTVPGPSSSAPMVYMEIGSNELSEALHPAWAVAQCEARRPCSLAELASADFARPYGQRARAKGS